MIEGQDGRITQVREYVISMRERIAKIRGVVDESASHSLATAFQEIETAHEELTVADEELRAQAESIASLRAGLEGELRHFRRLFDEAPDGYIVTDSHGIILEANRTMANALHVHPRFFDRKPLVSFVVRGDCRAFRGALLRLGAGDVIGNLVIALRPRDAQPPIVVDMRAVPLRPSGGRVTQVRWSVRLPAPASSANEYGEEGSNAAKAHGQAKLDGALARLNAMVLAKGMRLVVAREEDLCVDSIAVAAVAAIVEALVMSALETTTSEIHVVIAREESTVDVRVGDARVSLPVGGRHG